MEQAIISYPIKSNQKFRTIHTYAQNEAGNCLREKHELFIKNNEALLNKYNNESSFAYQHDKSVHSCVTKHLNNHYFLSLDIKNFFNSIDLKLLAEKLNPILGEDTTQEIISTCQLTNSDKGLAIGLIPSPNLANFYLSEFDSKLNDFLLNMLQDFTYTRYADDLMISSSEPIDIDHVIRSVQDFLTSEHLELNQKKINYQTLEKHRDYVRFLGLNIVRGKEENYLTVSRSFKRAAFHEKNHTRKRGMLSHIKYNEKI